MKLLSFILMGLLLCMPAFSAESGVRVHKLTSSSLANGDTVTFFIDASDLVSYPDTDGVFQTAIWIGNQKASTDTLDITTYTGAGDAMQVVDTTTDFEGGTSISLALTAKIVQGLRFYVIGADVSSVDVDIDVAYITRGASKGSDIWWKGQSSLAAAAIETVKDSRSPVYTLGDTGLPAFQATVYNTSGDTTQVALDGGYGTVWTEIGALGNVLDNQSKTFSVFEAFYPGLRWRVKNAGTPAAITSPYHGFNIPK